MPWLTKLKLFSRPFRQRSIGSKYMPGHHNHRSCEAKSSVASFRPLVWLHKQNFHWELMVKDVFGILTCEFFTTIVFTFVSNSEKHLYVIHNSYYMFNTWQVERKGQEPLTCIKSKITWLFHQEIQSRLSKCSPWRISRSMWLILIAV